MKTANRRRMPASNNRAHADLGDCLKRKLQNRDFRAAYNAEDKQIRLVIETFTLHRHRVRSVADA
jgi:hypothetical protein